MLGGPFQCVEVGANNLAGDIPSDIAMRKVPRKLTAQGVHITRSRHEIA